MQKSVDASASGSGEDSIVSQRNAYRYRTRRIFIWSVSDDLLRIVNL